MFGPGLDCTVARGRGPTDCRALVMDRTMTAPDGWSVLTPWSFEPQPDGSTQAAAIWQGPDQKRAMIHLTCDEGFGVMMGGDAEALGTFLKELFESVTPTTP